MNIYTRTGDAGDTAIIGGRVAKDDPRVEAYGTIDELNSFVGQAAALLDGELYSDMRRDLLEIQHELFDCGGDLAYARAPEQGWKVDPAMVDRLEAWIDKYDAETPDITRFILPGGSLAASSLHVCRTVCRRAERVAVTLMKTVETNTEVRRYLNRLSDLFFTLARTANARARQPDVGYARSAEVVRNRP